MKRLLSYLKRIFFHSENRSIKKDIKDNSNLSILGSWKLTKYTTLNGEEVKPHWKEVWSFAAMDEAETNGIYVCYYINLHSIVGKWGLDGDCLRLIRKESEIVFSIVELTEKRLTINSIDKNSFYSKLEFQRVQ